MKAHRLLPLLIALASCVEPGFTGDIPLPDPVSPGTAFVLTASATYTTSSLASFSTDAPLRGSDNLLLASGDAVLVKLGHWLGVLNRGLDSNLHLVGDGGTPGPQYALPGCGPHDALLLEDGRVAFSCFESADLLFLSLQTGEIESLSLAQFADADGLPELDHLALVGETLYVTAQRLDRNTGFTSTTPGLLIGVDVASLSVKDLAPEDPTTEALTLPCHDPYTRLLQTEDGSLLVGCVANFRTPAAGGLVEIFPTTGTMTLRATIDQLGGYPTALRLSPDKTPWVEVYTPAPDDPYTTLEMTIMPIAAPPFVPLIKRDGFVLGGFDFDSESTLYYALRDLEGPGVYRIRPDGEEEPPPLQLSLPPVDFAFF